MAGTPTPFPNSQSLKVSIMTVLATFCSLSGCARATAHPTSTFKLLLPLTAVCSRPLGSRYPPVGRKRPKDKIFCCPPVDTGQHTPPGTHPKGPAKPAKLSHPPPLPLRRASHSMTREPVPVTAPTTRRRHALPTVAAPAPARWQNPPNTIRPAPLELLKWGRRKARHLDNSCI